jgi:hypothetical protein
MTIRLLVGTLILAAPLVGCRTAPPDVRYSAADGGSVARAVVIEGAQNENSLVNAERVWIQKRFTGAALGQRNLVADPGTGVLFDAVELTTQDRKTSTVYFANPFAMLPAQERAGQK